LIGLQAISFANTRFTKNGRAAQSRQAMRAVASLAMGPCAPLQVFEKD